MKKTKKRSWTPIEAIAQNAPVVRENEFRAALRTFFELYPITGAIENSYVVSRFWAWFSQIQFVPHLSIPVPRYFTIRDP